MCVLDVFKIYKRVSFIISPTMADLSHTKGYVRRAEGNDKRDLYCYAYF
jgi:hypothetical protein